MHPCGVVLSRQPMHTLTPTFIANKGYATTHLDMDAVEAAGLVKMDILAQGGLAAMRDAKDSLARRGIAVDLDSLEPWRDPEVWEMIASGSVIRQGAANEDKKRKFTRRYQKMEAPEYPHPSLEPCLRSTFGLVVY